jgi:hypothetical protein
MTTFLENGQDVEECRNLPQVALTTCQPATPVCICQCNIQQRASLYLPVQYPTTQQANGFVRRENIR